LDASRLSPAQKILRPETETIERALDLVLPEHRRNQLAWGANERFLMGKIELKDAYDGLGTGISSRFKK
jgi:hypothetical protein